MCNALAIAAFTGAQVLAGQEQIKAMKAQARVQKQVLDREQYNKDVQYLEAENERRRQFIEQSKANEARLSTMGITGQGNSYKALAKRNYETFKEDLGALRFGAINMRQDIRDQKGLIDMNLKSSIKGVRLNQLSTIALGAYQYNVVAAEGQKLSDIFGFGGSKGGSIGRQSMLGFSKGTAGTGGFSPNPITGEYKY